MPSDLKLKLSTSTGAPRALVFYFPDFMFSHPALVSRFHLFPPSLRILNFQLNLALRSVAPLQFKLKV